MLMNNASENKTAYRKRVVCQSEKVFRYNKISNVQTEIDCYRPETITAYLQHKVPKMAFHV